MHALVAEFTYHSLSISLPLTVHDQTACHVTCGLYAYVIENLYGVFDMGYSASAMLKGASS